MEEMRSAAGYKRPAPTGLKLPERRLSQSSIPRQPVVCNRKEFTDEVEKNFSPALLSHALDAVGGRAGAAGGGAGRRQVRLRGLRGGEGGAPRQQTRRA